MKQLINSLFKTVLIFALIYYSPIKTGFLNFMKNNISFNSLLYTSNVDFDIDSTLLLVEKYGTEYIEYPNENTVASSNKKVKTVGNIKKVLIYSTHQNEEYLDYGDVVSASKYLAEILENTYSIEVDVIEENFIATASMYGYNYNKLYSISRMFLEEYLMNGTYDLIIDFHRDALPRELTYITHNGKNYAKIMADIGTNNPNHLVNLEYAQTLTDKISSYNIPIMKPVYTIASTYNQDLADNIMLIEFGSDQNYYQEVKNSIEVLAKAIDEMMR